MNELVAWFLLGYALAFVVTDIVDKIKAERNWRRFVKAKRDAQRAQGMKVTI